MISTLITAFGLFLIIEGLLYAIFPNTMKSMVGKMLNSSNESLKWTGIISAVIGLFLIWLVRE
tara:strand:+ start:804 stop:992 length:189 start_codon:yes stop_codon:yes gene_type:complete